MRSADATPEQQAVDHETALLLEEAIDALPDNYRPVFVLREVESSLVELDAERPEAMDELAVRRATRAS